MKPAPFDYVRAMHTDQALELLASAGDESKLLAGGQSLIPMLNFRLARPALLIDIGRIGELAYITRQDGTLRIGATTRQAQLERSKLVGEGWPLLARAIGWVAHPQIRSVGTVGGSVAHADPAAELPVACSVLEARMTVAGRSGKREISADDFFVTHLTSAIEADEMLLEIAIPAAPDGAGQSFVEYSRRHGDFALGGAAVVMPLDAEGRCVGVRITLMTAAPVPWRARTAEKLLEGSAPELAMLSAAAEAAASEINPTGDIHGGSSYRKALARTLCLQALTEAAATATPPKATGMDQ